MPMSKRDQILRASVTILRRDGLAAMTTKKVAEEAGCAEGTIFNQFGDKGRLLAAVLSFGLPEAQAFEEAVAKAMHPPLTEGLTAVCTALLDYYEVTYPITAAALTDRGLFDHYAAAHRGKDTGPARPLRRVRDLLDHKSLLGEIRSDVDFGVVALQLVGACQNAAWLEMVNGPGMLPCPRSELAARLATDVTRQLSFTT